MAVSLKRELGTGDAVLIGLGSMIGAGVFAAFAPAAPAAGTGLLIGLALAAGVAFANATSSAQLAAVYPTSGGTYVYGRERLGPWWGFFAGWSFVIGKTASCAAMALTFAAYVAPSRWERPVGALAVVVLVAVNYLGVTRTALATRLILVVTLTALGVSIVSGASTGLPRLAELGGDLAGNGWYGILQSAGLLFFAFAGYARIATMGEEVRNPAVTIPRAVGIALAIVVVIYAVVAIIVLGCLGADGVASSPVPLAAAATVSGSEWVSPVVRVGAGAASLGALLALLTGIGRTTLAMARNADLPLWLSAVHPRFAVPARAELVLGVVVVVLVLTTDLRGALAFSSFGVLLYYLIANLAAWTQPAGQRRWPKWLQVAGATGCLVLVATLPGGGIVAGGVVLLVGLAYRLLRTRGSRDEIL